MPGTWGQTCRGLCKKDAVVDRRVEGPVQGGGVLPSVMASSPSPHARQWLVPLASWRSSQPTAPDICTKDLWVVLRGCPCRCACTPKSRQSVNVDRPGSGGRGRLITHASQSLGFERLPRTGATYSGSAHRLREGTHPTAPYPPGTTVPQAGQACQRFADGRLR